MCSRVKSINSILILIRKAEKSLNGLYLLCLFKVVLLEVWILFVILVYEILGMNQSLSGSLSLCLLL